MKSKNPLITEPIPKMIRQIGLPVGIGVLFNNLFQVVDTFYAGAISKEALAALALSFPIFFIIIGLASGLATGAIALIGNALGEDKPEEASYIIGQGLLLTTIMSFVTSSLGLAVSPFLFGILGATGEGLDINMSYITPIFQGTLFFNLVFMFNASLSAQGNTRPFRNFLLMGFVLNIFLDPWFIYGGLGLEPMGVAGVGVATALIQGMGMIYLGITAFQSDLFKSFQWKMLIPSWRRITQIIHQGLPPALDLSTVSVGGFVVTYFISRFGTEAVGAYGIASRVEGLIWIPLVGLDVATLSLIAQNNGAALYDRMWLTFNTAIRYGLILMAVSGVIVFVFAYQLIGIFTNDPEIIEIGVIYIRIGALALPAKPLGFIGFAALRGIKRPLLPMVMSMIRMIVLPAIVLYILIIQLDLGLTSIWWTIASITVLSGLLAWYAVIKLMPRSKTKTKS
jgi:putative MATE family efflux protein